MVGSSLLIFYTLPTRLRSKLVLLQIAMLSRDAILRGLDQCRGEFRALDRPQRAAVQILAGFQVGQVFGLALDFQRIDLDAFHFAPAQAMQAGHQFPRLVALARLHLDRVALAIHRDQAPQCRGLVLVIEADAVRHEDLGRVQRHHLRIGEERRVAAHASPPRSGLDAPTASVILPSSQAAGDLL